MGTRNLVLGLLLGCIGALLCQFDFTESNETPSTTIPLATVSTSKTSFAGREPASHAKRSMATGKLKQLLRDSIKDARYQPATPAELIRFERLIVRTLNVSAYHRDQSFDVELFDQWSHAGWQLHRCDDDVLVISESPGRRTGRGIFAVHMLSESKLVLQAPHRFYDEGSGLIVRKLFQENSIRAAAWNTVHRREVDLAHAENQHLDAFTRAIIIADSEATFVQLHGFNNDKYAWDMTTRAGSADMILSDGSQFPSRETLRSTANLKASFGADAVLLFPDEVGVLGGTTNRQSRLLRNLGSNRFLHIEMSKALRKQMLEHKNARDQFYSAI